MIVRDYRPEDKPELDRIHAKSGLDYKLDLDNPLFFLKKVLEVDGTVRAALVNKVCAETMLLLGEARPQDKFLAMQLLQGSVLTEAYRQGFDEIHASIPDIGFDKRLLQLGWEKDRPGWTLWTRSTLAISAKPGG